MVRGGDTLAYWTTAEMYTVENAMFLGWPGDACDEKISVNAR
jgi:hypothetical protein